MLYPQNNRYRQMTDLSGFWHIRFDEDDSGAFGTGFENGEIIAVPASWNDQINERRDYLGTAWYQTRFTVPWAWRSDRQRVYLRFNSVNYRAAVWLNGVRLGEHEGGHLPFVFDVTEQVDYEDNLLVVQVNGDLQPDNVPPGNLAGQAGITFGHADLPDTNFDFFPYCGIQRPVLLYTTPVDTIQDITVVTTIEGTTGVVQVTADYPPNTTAFLPHESPLPLILKVSVHGHGVEQFATSDTREVQISIPNAAFWSPDAPNLYQLKVEVERVPPEEIIRGNPVIDAYHMDIGIRTIRVERDQLLLNNEPVKLLGFGRHEDFPVVGRGMLPALIVKDYGLLRWIGANSFRTSHYPYSEQMMQLADQLGFLVIDETPAVGLFFTEPGLERRNQLCKQYIRELIDCDKNHPSVIMWSLANEPHTARPEARETYYRQGFEVIDNPSHAAAVMAFEEQAALARSLDPTRPITIVSHEGATEEAWQFVDVLSLNRYNGWYSQTGHIGVGVQTLSREIDLIHERFSGPFILTEFGADTIPGHHAEPPEMFSEEYQAEFLAQYMAMLDTKPFVIGQHIWNLCDFKTSQGVIRMGAQNYKGVFTRDRRPKLAAHKVRELWRGKD